MPMLLVDKNIRDELEQLLQRDAVDNPIIVSRSTLRVALERFLENEVVVDDLVSWANLIEAYDQVQYEVGFEKLIADVLFSIASPEINGPLNRGTCRRFLSQLSV
jgi:hypothetical protein